MNANYWLIPKLILSDDATPENKQNYFNKEVEDHIKI